MRTKLGVHGLRRLLLMLPSLVGITLAVFALLLVMILPRRRAQNPVPPATFSTASGFVRE